MADSEPVVTVSEKKSVQSDLERRVGVITDIIVEINARLFKDNGQLSIQTRLDRVSRILYVICWMASIVGSALILAFLTFLWKTIAKVWF